MRLKWTVQICMLVALTTTLAHGQEALQRLPSVVDSRLTPVSFVEAAEQFNLQPLSPIITQPVAASPIVAAQPAALPTYSVPVPPMQEASWGDGPAYDKGPAKYCPPCWAHRSGVFGEFLYLRPRDSEVAYALLVNGNVPAGEVGIADPDYSPGYRVGFSKALDECSSLVAAYTSFESNTNDFLNTNPPPAIRGLLLHPATTNAASDFLTATARYDIDFRAADFDYRAVLTAGDSAAINYIVGARYAHLDQDLRVAYTNAGTTETIVTDVEFDGAGFRLGLDAERCTHHGFLFYGKAMSTFLVGDFRATYNHASTAGGASVANTAWRAGRIVPILDLELGTGWQSHSGHWRMTAGYVVSAWLNTVNTDEWVEAVRGNSFEGLNDGMTFDGLTAKAEYRF